MRLPTNSSSLLCPSEWSSLPDVWSIETHLARREGAGGPLMAGQVQLHRKRPYVDFGHETSAMPTLAPSPVRPHTRQAQERVRTPRTPCTTVLRAQPLTSRHTWAGGSTSPSPSLSPVTHRWGGGEGPQVRAPTRRPHKVTVISRERPRQSGKPSKNVYCEISPTPSE